MKPSFASNDSWIYALPRQMACSLLAICLLVSQLYPCDSTVSVANGDSVIFIVLAFGIGFLLAIDFLLSRECMGPNASVRWLLGLSFLFCGWLWFCAYQLQGRENARFTFNGCWQWIAQVILLLSISRLSVSRKVAASIVSLMVSCAAGTVGYAFFQYFVTLPNLRKSFATDPASFLTELGYTVGSSESILYTNRLQSLEPTGPFVLTNSLAGFLAGWLVLLFALICNAALSKPIDQELKKRRNGRAIAWPTVAVLLAISLMSTLFLTKSRTAWLSTAIGALIVLIVSPRVRSRGLSILKRHWQIAIAVALIGIAGLTVLLIQDPMLIGEAGKSLLYRFDYWRGAMSLILASPWIGYGACNFQANYNRVKPITASESPADPHNFLLETAFAGGLPLLLVLILSLGMLAWILGRRLTQKTNDRFSAKSMCPSETSFAGIPISLGAGCAAVGAFAFHFLASTKPTEGMTKGDDLFYSVAIFLALGIAVYFFLERSKWLVWDEGTEAFLVVAAFVVLLHLVASGGWMLPGVMNSVCVFVGVGIGNGNRAKDVGPIERSESRPTRSVGYRVALLLLIVAAAGDFARTMCLPVQRVSESGLVNPNNVVLLESQGTEALREFMNIDPWDPELPRMIATTSVKVLGERKLATSEHEKWMHAFDDASQEYLRRDPNNWISESECGRWNSTLLRKQPADRHFRRSAALFPSSISVQLQAAVSSAWCGNFKACREYLAQVEKIDDSTTHADRKLNTSLVFFSPEFESQSSPLDGSARRNLQVGMARGEPVMRWLRTIVH